MTALRAFVQDVGHRALTFATDLGGMSILAGRTLCEAVTPPYGARLLMAQMHHIAIRDGEPLTIIGGSGLGKRVLLRLMIGLLKPDAGRILLEGQDIVSLRERR
jgi:ABC-type bacteriocin/lantibiotic exporter with double-glycine peptidase domain